MMMIMIIIILILIDRFISNKKETILKAQQSYIFSYTFFLRSNNDYNNIYNAQIS